MSSTTATRRARGAQTRKCTPLPGVISAPTGRRRRSGMAIASLVAKTMPGRRRKPRLPEIVTDPVESAKAAGLRYVTDDTAGIRRRRVGKSFTYLDGQGDRVRDPDILRRIRALAIPPAWTDVWICPSAHGHIQAVGRD